jgi:protein-arginine kinase activator protein McsA
MLTAAENLDFEKAAMFRDEIRKIKKDQMGIRQ